MIENIVTYRLVREERETICRYSDGDTYCTCCTSIPKDIRKLSSKGWLMVSCDKLADGTIVAAKFTCPVEYLSIRTFPASVKKSVRTISDEQQSTMQNRRRNNAN